jgi:anaerobic magnesium-protoporphyrin IX monomethyl ester cyclase
MKNEKYLVSVIIPTYNNKLMLDLSLKSLTNQKFDFPYEIIVVDDGSNDGTKKLVEKYKEKYNNLTYLFQEDNGFRAGLARNLGASKSNSEILIFLNDDMVCRRDFINNHIESQKKHDLVLGYSASYNNKNETYKIKQFQDINHKNLDQIKIIKEFRDPLFNKTPGEYSNNNWWKFFVASNISIKKKLFDKFKFDENFIGWGIEDVELGYRLFLKGIKVKFSKKCLAFNLERDNENELNETKKNELLKNLDLFYSKFKTKEVGEFVKEKNKERFNQLDLKEIISKKGEILEILITRNSIQILLSLITKLSKKGIKKIKLVYPEFVKGNSEFNKKVPYLYEAVDTIEKSLTLMKELNIEHIINNKEYILKKPLDLLNGFEKAKIELSKGKNGPKKVSIIIPCQNRKGFLKKSIDALLKQNYDAQNYEIIIVDDGSNDGTREMIDKLQTDVSLKYIFWPRKTPFIKGAPLNRVGPVRNLGVKFASSDIIIFIDCDIVVNPNFIKEHIKSHKKYDIVIGPSIREKSGKDVREGYFKICNDDLSKMDCIWELAHEGNISFNKKDFLNVGGFSSDFVYWAFEGDDLAYKLIKNHHKKMGLNKKAYGAHLYHSPEFINKETLKEGAIYNSEVLYKKNLDKEIYDRFFVNPQIKVHGNLKKCIRNDYENVPYSSMLMRCIDEKNCQDVELCKCQPNLVKELINVGEETKVFFRDDDIDGLNKNLQKLIELFVEEKIPISLQIIPKKITKECANFLIKKKEENPHLIELCQHGFNHNKTEFSQSYEKQTKSIKEGGNILNNIFGKHFTKIFTPPYHIFNNDTFKALKNNQFEIFSNGPMAKKNYENLKLVNTNVDFIEKYEPKIKYKTEVQIIKDISYVKSKTNKVGILLHHKFLRGEDFNSLKRIIKLLKSNKRYSIKTIQDVVKDSIDVLLINPSYQPHWSKCEPSGLISLASYLNVNEIKSKIIDFNVNEFNEDILIDYIKKNKPSLVGIGSVTKQAIGGYKIGNFIKKNFPDIKLCYGGVHATSLPKEPLEKGSADFVVVGEGEKTFLELVNFLKENNTNFEKIDGIVFKSNQEIKFTKKREFIKDLDQIPIPDYNLVNLNKYNTSIHVPGFYKEPAVHLMTSRGCVYNCKYCNSPSLYKCQIRRFSVKRVIDEIKNVVEEHSINNFHIHDDIFMHDKEWVKGFCNKIIEEKLNINWIILDRVELIIKNKELLPLMKKAGCKGVEIGVESPDELILENINKKQKIDDIKKANHILKENKLIPMYLLIAYCPGETIDTPKNSISMLNDLFDFNILNSDEVNLTEIESRLMSHMMRPSPGSEFYKSANEDGMIISKDWNDHYEERINFIPNSLLDDIPEKKVLVAKNVILDKFIKDKQKIKLLINTNHYIPRNLQETFYNLKDYLNFVAHIYTILDDEKTIKENYDEFSEEYKGIGIDLFISAISVLSIYGFIKSKKIKYMKYIKDLKENGCVSKEFIPKAVEIRLTDLCNLSCKMCLIHRKKEDNVLNLELIKKTLDDIKAMGVVFVVFSGGEPLLRKDFIKIADYANSIGLKFILITNGILLDDKLADFINKNSFLTRFSIDGGSAKIHDCIRGEGNFVKTIKSLDNLIKKRKEMNYGCTIGVNSVIQDENFQKIPELIDFFENKGVDFYEFDVIGPIDKFKNFKKFLNECLNGKNHSLYKVLCSKKADNLSIFSDIESVKLFLNEGEPYDIAMDFIKKNEIPCLGAKEDINISPEGIIYPCCFRYRDPGFELGDISRSNIGDIWHSKKYNDFRKNTLNLGNGICNGCEPIMFFWKFFNSIKNQKNTLSKIDLDWKIFLNENMNFENIIELIKFNRKVFKGNIVLIKLGYKPSLNRILEECKNQNIKKVIKGD